MDEIDREILHALQEDASRSVREIGELIGLSPTPCWRRIKNLEDRGVISRRVALVDPDAVNLGVVALVLVRTNQHNQEWLTRFVSPVSTSRICTVQRCRSLDQSERSTRKP